MAWAKLDDQFFRHPKARAAGRDGRALFLASLCFSAGNLTDGFIRESDLPLVAAEAEVRPSVSRSLVKAGLWDVAEGGWNIHDFEDFNPSSDAVKERREKERDKKRRRRRGQDGRYLSPLVSPGDNPGESHGDTLRESRGESPGVSDQPVPVPPRYKSSSTNAGGETGPPTTTRCSAVIDLIVDQRIARLSTPPSNPSGYRQTVAGDVRKAHGAAIVQLLRENPDLTAAQAAAKIEPPAPAPVPRAPDPTERTAEAARKRDERLAAAARGEACATCDGIGHVDAGDGTYARCPVCNPL